eukprot:13659946-Alexandrium_andersonii.AAC.1
MTRRIPLCGNPRCYSTLLDESLNAIAAPIASASHRSRWEINVFTRLRVLPQVEKRSYFAAS